MHRHVYMRDVFTVCEKETTNENRNITKIRKTIKIKEKKETSARKIAPKIRKKAKNHCYCMENYYRNFLFAQAPRERELKKNNKAATAATTGIN